VEDVLEVVGPQLEKLVRATSTPGKQVGLLIMNCC
jgi:hypothetical protein